MRNNVPTMFEVTEPTLADIKLIYVGGEIDVSKKDIINVTYLTRHDDMKITFSDYSSITIAMQDKDTYNYISTEWHSHCLGGRITDVSFERGITSNNVLKCTLRIGTTEGQSSCSMYYEKGRTNKQQKNITFQVINQENTDEF